MCLICVEYQKKRMTLGEAERALSEMVDGMDPRHAEEVRALLREGEGRQNTRPPAKSKPRSP